MADVHPVIGSILGKKDGVEYTYQHLPNSSLRVIKASKGAVPKELQGGFSSQLDCLNAVNRYIHGKELKAEKSAQLKLAEAKQAQLEKALRVQKAKDAKLKKAK